MAVFDRAIDRLRSELPVTEVETVWNAGRSLGEDRALREAIDLCRSLLAEEGEIHGGDSRADTVTKDD